jgi:hypothetical protein
MSSRYSAPPQYFEKRVGILLIIGRLVMGDMRFEEVRT